MNIFLDNDAWKSGAYCLACQAGPDLRMCPAARFLVPDEAARFPCPSGRLALILADRPEAVADRQVVAIETAPFVRERIAICEDCDHWSVTTARCKIGCTACDRKRPNAVCPDEPPRWLPAINGERT